MLGDHNECLPNILKFISELSGVTWVLQNYKSKNESLTEVKDNSFKLCGFPNREFYIAKMDNFKLQENFKLRQWWESLNFVYKLLGKAK